MRILTTLNRAQLCAALSTSEATRILGSPPRRRSTASESGLGIYCRWPKRGAARLSTDELYVGISSVVDWTGAQQVDKLLHAKPVTVDGRPALTAGPLPAMQWAQVDVALGGAGDPVAEYRAPDPSAGAGPGPDGDAAHRSRWASRGSAASARPDGQLRISWTPGHGRRVRECRYESS